MLERCERKTLLGWRLLELLNRVNASGCSDVTDSWFMEMNGQEDGDEQPPPEVLSRWECLVWCSSREGSRAEQSTGC